MTETRTAESDGAQESPEQIARQLERVIMEVKKVIVGQEAVLERTVVALLAGGHCLLEGVPGVAKTLTVKTLADVVGGSFARLQFTPDLVPSDIVGTRIYRGSSESFDIELGPVFANFVLTDEINRAPAKVQSALLEVMAEGQVSVGGQTFKMPRPFVVLATQNPIENEGVYPLPEAQRDRFLMKVLVGYPTASEEREIIYRMGGEAPEAKQILSPEQLKHLQQMTQRVFVDHAIIEYVVRVILVTRTPGEHNLQDVARWVSYGASPRASLGLIAAARGLALLRGRGYVLPQDVVDLVPDILRHRLVLSYDALADGVPVEHVVSRIMETVPPPQVAPRQSWTGLQRPPHAVPHPSSAYVPPPPPGAAQVEPAR